MSTTTAWGIPLSGPATPDEMAADMQASLDKLLSSHAGAAAPSYKVLGTRWADTSVAGILTLKQWDGGAWRVIYSIATATGKTTLPAHTLGGPLDAGGYAISNMTAAFLPGYLFGLQASNNAADADHDIDFAIGAAASDNIDPLIMRLSVGMTKRADAAFSAGSGNGAMVAGEAMPSNGTVHWWLIMKSDGTIDICCNNQASSGLNPVLPTGYVFKRRICSLVTDSSARFIGFNQFGDYFEFKTTQLALNTGSLGTTATAYTLIVPIGVAVDACIRAVANKTGAAGFAVINAISEGAIVPNSPVGNANLSWNGSGMFTYSNITVRTNTNGQIYAASSLASTLLQVSQIGYSDNRRS